MIAAQFDYKRANTLDEALTLLAQNEDAKILAGGHSLIPAMKLRLMQPPLLIDIGRIKDLAYIREEDGQIRIGAMTTHYEIESSELLKKICPPCRIALHTSATCKCGTRERLAAVSRTLTPPAIGLRRSLPSMPSWSWRASSANAQSKLTISLSIYLLPPWNPARSCARFASTNRTAARDRLM